MTEEKHTPGINADRLLILMGEGQDGFHVVAKHLDKESRELLLLASPLLKNLTQPL